VIQRFFIDEDLLGLTKVWNRVGEEPRRFCWPGHGCDARLGDPDDVWIPIVASERLIVITEDAKIRTRPAEVAAVLKHRLRIVRLATGRNPVTPANYAERLDRQWPKIEAFVEARPVGAWWLAVTARNVEELAVGQRGDGWGKDAFKRALRSLAGDE